MKEASIAQLQAAMQDRQFSARELVLYYMNRIAKVDKCANGYNSVLELNPDALFLADALDDLRRQGTILGPLHGIPILLKDNISTMDKMHTSAGSLALADHYARRDAHIVTRLRQAGAILLGKANMTEFANYMASDMSNGYSSRGGQVLCPFVHSKDPSGSSTGSAVAVATDLCAAAIGTETCGSIVSPSEVNGIVGIKPTLGMVSRHGIIPIAYTLDTAGPMARSAADAALLLGVISGHDENDPSTYTMPETLPIEAITSSLQGLHIGISRIYSEEVDKQTLQATEHLIHLLDQNGARLTEITEPRIKASKALDNIMKYEFKSAINAYLSSFGTSQDIHSLQDIIVYNQRHDRVALKYGQSVLLEAQNLASGTLTEPEYIEAITERDAAVRTFDRVFTDNGLDVLLSVVPRSLPPFVGFPSMTIPIGMTEDNMPIGSYWIGRRFQDQTLLRAAYAAEQLLPHRPCMLSVN